MVKPSVFCTILGSPILHFFLFFFSPFWEVSFAWPWSFKQIFKSVIARATDCTQHFQHLPSVVALATIWMQTISLQHAHRTPTARLQHAYRTPTARLQHAYSTLTTRLRHLVTQIVSVGFSLSVSRAPWQQFASRTIKETIYKILQAMVWKMCVTRDPLKNNNM